MRYTAIALLTALLSLTSSSSAAVQDRAIDWNKQRAEILQHYRALVQIDSSSPPGNETKVVEYLKKALEAEGIPSRFRSRSESGNLVARLKGNGSKRPLLILAHTDVVPVQKEVAGRSFRRGDQRRLYLGQRNSRR
jgi:hypothetical protein